jgi:hypothetical protein
MEVFYVALLLNRISGLPEDSSFCLLVPVAVAFGIGCAELVRGCTTMISSFKNWKTKRESISESTIDAKGIL